jgi:hypothetical protein
VTLDVTIRNTWIKNVAAGFQIANARSDAGAFAKDGGRYSIHNVLVENLDGDRFHGHGVMFEILSAQIVLHDISIDHVTGMASRALFMLGARTSEAKIANFTLTNNLLGVGRLQQIILTGMGTENCAYRPEVQGPAGVFASCFTNSKVAGNVIVGGSNKWPAKNSLVKQVSDVGFKAADKNAISDYRLHTSSKYKGAGIDQKDVGADIDTIEAATKDVL